MTMQTDQYEASSPEDVISMFRADLTTIPIYKPGKPIEEVAHDLGLDDIVKLASNECPERPFPEVEHAIVRAAAESHRYPDTSSLHVMNALALHYGIPADHFLIGAGSSQLIGCTLLAAGGPGASAVFADPSFVMYTIASLVSHTEPIPVRVDGGYHHDLDAMRSAIREDTKVMFLCNPNNPTGNHIAGDAVLEFIDSVPTDVLVVVDEAYGEYVTAPDYESAIPVAIARDNVVVSRTFSKVYGLSGFRVGYYVGTLATLDALRRVQPPFSVTSVSQAAAVEALRHQHRVVGRAAVNAAERDRLYRGFTGRGVVAIPSQANFIAIVPDDPERMERELLGRGVIVRRLGDIVRITVGTAEENSRLLEAWDDIA